ncbi:hypothetical protein IscW_ISCW014329 [Ixodes scapularis]|uniref:Uncharacterized protein n=1 Tax=Ixodes scapularis TaxID=6945 RepID=B7QIX4_IXOSC|nr:hypothetical protein IscW_ISCW014329 [Ixodes scapularis]|eukprot:XP_002415131.1 hypothetical protein IscW_ISCW014329 [Ixodes scapularis]
MLSDEWRCDPLHAHNWRRWTLAYFAVAFAVFSACIYFWVGRCDCRQRWRLALCLVAFSPAFLSFPS